MITLIWKARRKMMAVLRSHGLWDIKDPAPEEIPGLIQKIVAIIPTIINIILEHVSDEKFIEIITSDKRFIRTPLLLSLASILNRPLSIKEISAALRISERHTVRVMEHTEVAIWFVKQKMTPIKIGRGYIKDDKKVGYQLVNPVQNPNLETQDRQILSTIFTSVFNNMKENGPWDSLLSRFDRPQISAALQRWVIREMCLMFDRVEEVLEISCERESLYNARRELTMGYQQINKPELTKEQIIMKVEEAIECP